MGKLLAGGRVRRLREERGLSQAALARLLAISPSYLNQIEHDARPLTATVLVRLTEALRVDPAFFAPREGARQLAELREALLSAADGPRPPLGDVQQVVTSMPEVAEAIIALHRRHRDAMLQLESLTDGRSQPVTSLPHERVRDFFYSRQNYFDTVDRAAERLAASIGTRRGEVRRFLKSHLEAHHDIRVVAKRDVLDHTHTFDPDTRILTLSGSLRPGQQAFRMATQLAFEAAGEELEEVLGEVVWPDETTRRLARIALAHHFAGAFVLPYRPFFRAAERFRYDVEKLSEHFGVGYEMAAHRLSTLQRSDLPGVPFIFVRVDRAGNVSKRQSATGFHFSRGGGTCPLWSVYDAFATPTRMAVQIAEMPDGERLLWVARCVTQRRGSYGSIAKTFVIGLGCELRQADRVVYSTGLNLTKPDPTPIGPGCRTCTRRECPQRSAPPVDASLLIDEHSGTFVPYPLRNEEGTPLEDSGA